MIASVRDRRVTDLLAGRVPARFPADFARRAQRTVVALDLAKGLEDLRNPPSNHLESLRGNRAGQWSIRINLQWRLCFRWTDRGAEDVEIVDYH